VALADAEMSEWSYEPQDDAGYIRLAVATLNVIDEKIVGVRHEETIEVVPGEVFVDLDNHNRVVGIEILGAKRVNDVLGSKDAL